MAQDINSVTLVGRLTRDVEMRYSQGGMAIASFSIAVNYRKKSGDNWVEEASFFDCKLFGRQAEAVQRFLTKGKQVGVNGELRQDRWEQDGQRRSRVEIICNNLQLLGGRDGGGGGSSDDGDSYGSQAASDAPPSSASSFDDDIPF